MGRQEEKEARKDEEMEDARTKRKQCGRGDTGERELPLQVPQSASWPGPDQHCMPWPEFF